MTNELPLFTDVSPADLEDAIASNPVMQDLAFNDKQAFLDRAHQLYSKAGYDYTTKQPRRTAQRAFAAIERTTGIPEGLTRTAASAAVSGAYTAAGTAIGAATGLLAGPAAPIAVPALSYAGAAAGSVQGEHALAAMGITDEPTTGDLTLAAAAPLVGPLARRTWRGMKGIVVRKFPGAGTGVNEAALEITEAKVKQFQISDTDVDDAWNLYKSTGLHQQPLPKLAAFLNEKREITETFSVLPAKMRKRLEAIQRGDAATPNDLDYFRQTFNALKATDKTGIAKRASGLLIEDMDKFVQQTLAEGAPASTTSLQGIRALKAAMALTKRKHAGDDLEEAFTAATSERKTDQLKAFNRSTFIKKLRDINLPKAELDDIEQVVRDIGYITPLPGEGISSVTREFLPIGMFGAAVGGAVHSLTDLPVGNIYTPVMATTAALGLISSRLLQSETGRKWIGRVVREQGGKISELQLREMHAALIGGTTGAMFGATSGEPSTTTMRPMPLEQ